MTKVLVCTNCGYFGKPKTVTKGSMLIEIALWLCFLFPGLIYSLWRVSSKHTACPKCGNAHMIPSDTPMGKKALTDLGVSESSVKETEEKAAKEMSPGLKKVLIIVGAVVAIGFIYGIIKG